MLSEKALRLLQNALPKTKELSVPYVIMLVSDLAPKALRDKGVEADYEYELNVLSTCAGMLKHISDWSLKDIKVVFKNLISSGVMYAVYNELFQDEESCLVFNGLCEDFLETLEDLL